MVRATAARAVRPNLTVAAELRLALPWSRTTSAVRRGRGGGGAGACDSRERQGDLSPSSLRNRQRLRTQQPRPAPPLSPPPCPAPRAIPRWARPPPEPVPWRDATRGGRKFIRLRTCPSHGESQLLARRTPRPPLRRADALRHQPSTRTRGAGAEWGAAPTRHFFPRPPTAAEPLVLLRRAAPAFSSSVTISQNPITSQSRPPPIGQWGG